MPKLKIEYEIDDDLDIEDNIAAFSEVIKSVDEELAAVLEPELACWAAGNAMDQVAIWDALFTATAPVEIEADNTEEKP